MKGKLIVFEGADGSGKSTVLQMVCDSLTDRGFDIVITREPGGTEIGEQIRSILLNSENSEMDYSTEAMLYAASRAQHVRELIVPSIEQGKIVICDRFIVSSLVYQGIGRKLGINTIIELNELSILGLVPDLTVFLSVNSENSKARRVKRALTDRLEEEGSSFHEIIRSGYEDVAKVYKTRYNISTVDANRSISEVFRDSLELVIKAIEEEIL